MHPKILNQKEIQYILLYNVDYTVRTLFPFCVFELFRMSLEGDIFGDPSPAVAPIKPVTLDSSGDIFASAVSQQPEMKREGLPQIIMYLIVYYPNLHEIGTQQKVFRWTRPLYRLYLFLLLYLHQL